ncbi:MAG: hypothetical protein HY261_01950 [Chloroflexi bacterium]|nr:hypothetical protein [Chloroflexota bacterium]
MPHPHDIASPCHRVRHRLAIYCCSNSCPNELACLDCDTNPCVNGCGDRYLALVALPHSYRCSGDLVYPDCHADP